MLAETVVARATALHGRQLNSAASGPVSQDSTTGVGAGAVGDQEPQQDWITGRWPAIMRIEERIAASDLEGARQLLTDWAAPGFEELCLDLEDPQRLEVAERIDALAAKTSLLGVQLGARELRHEVLGRTLPADHAELLAAKQNLAVTHYGMGDVTVAHALFDYVHAARARTLTKDDPDLLTAKSNLAFTSFALGDFDGARALYEYMHASLAQHLTPDDPRLLAVKRGLAASYYAMGDFAGALVLFEYVHDARERQQLPVDHPELLAAKQILADTRYALGDYDGAQALYEYIDFVQGRRLPVDHQDLLATKGSLAKTRYALGDIEGALELFEYVHAAQERLLPAGHPKLIVAKQNLAIKYFEQGELTRAMALWEYVVSVWELELPADDERLLMAKSNLATIRHKLGDFAGALVLKEYVVAMWERERSEDHADVLKAKLSLASTRSALGDFSGALLLEEHVHAAYERLRSPDHTDLLAAKTNLASTLYEMGNLPSARALLEYVAHVRESQLPAYHPDVLRARSNIAVIRSDMGDFEGALELEEPVYSELERLLPAGDPRLLRAKHSLAATSYALAEIDSVRKYSVSLLEDQVAVASSVSTLAPRIARAAALRELERLTWQAFWSEALEAAELPNLSSELLVSLESLRLVSTASSEVARAAARGADAELEDARTALARIAREITDASHTAPTDATALEEWRSRLSKLSEERDRLQSDIRRRLDALGLGFDMPTVASIAAGIEESGAYVGYWRYDRRSESAERKGEYVATDSLLAFVVTRDGRVARVELGAAAPIEALVERWREAIGKPVLKRSDEMKTSDEIEFEAGCALRRALVDPVLAALGDERPSKLHVVPDDMLHLVPLDALPMDDETALGQSIAVRIEPSVLRLIRPLPAPSGPESLVAFGGVDFDAGALAVAADATDAVPTGAVAVDTRLSDGLAVVRERSGSNNFGPLPATRLEAKKTAELFEEHLGPEPVVHFGADATKSALIDLAPTARYLHLATHGWFTPEARALSMFDGFVAKDAALGLAVDRAQDTVVGFLPETLCGLVLAGANQGTQGWLTAEELATLDLTNCELAVLSACETNVGIRRAGQGIQSLQSALHAAGARTAITSLWRVSDEATQLFFEVFYTKLWRDGLGKADALWHAKMWLREKSYPTSDWAGWVLSGDPN
jgi:CHAT domain-containing protein